MNDEKVPFDFQQHVTFDEDADFEAFINALIEDGDYRKKLVGDPQDASAALAEYGIIIESKYLQGERELPPPWVLRDAKQAIVDDKLFAAEDVHFKFMKFWPIFAVAMTKFRKFEPPNC